MKKIHVDLSKEDHDLLRAVALGLEMSMGAAVGALIRRFMNPDEHPIFFGERLHNEWMDYQHNHPLSLSDWEQERMDRNAAVTAAMFKWLNTYGLAVAYDGAGYYVYETGAQHYDLPGKRVACESRESAYLAALGLIQEHNKTQKETP